MHELPDITFRIKDGTRRQQILNAHEVQRLPQNNAEESLLSKFYQQSNSSLFISSYFLRLPQRLKNISYYNDPSANSKPTMTKAGGGPQLKYSLLLSVCTKTRYGLRSYSSTVYYNCLLTGAEGGS